MAYKFEQLAPEYAKLLASARITRASEIERRADVLIKLMPRYRTVEAATNVPALVLAGLNERESSSDFGTYLGNGQILSRKTTIVPKGRGPFKTWEDGAIDALHYDKKDRVAAEPGGWNWVRACFEGESWNGFGPRNHGIHTGYLWAGMTPYVRGKYIRDGIWDPTHVDTQLGMIPIMKALVARDPSLDLGHEFETTSATLPRLPRSDYEALDTVRVLQMNLNTLLDGEDLIVDGSYGRRTTDAVRRFQKQAGLKVDGIAGPKTNAAIKEALEARQ